MDVNNFFSLDQIFIIAEAGSNWKAGSYDEDLVQAKKLIDIAASSGADAVKFQTYRAETVYVKNPGVSDYLFENGIHENITEIFERHEMPYKMIPELSEYCQQKNILFMSSPFSVEDAKEIDPYVKIHKIASFEINHVRLIEFILKTQKPIIISTGASTYKEIDFLVDLLKKNNHNNFALLQCTSKYPSPLSALNLSVIPKIQERYNVQVGFSDHSTDPIIGPILSIGFGAKIIEKHFTLDKNLPGPDHSFALDPVELKLMVDSIRKAENASGLGIKEILPEEEELHLFASRSLQAIKKIKSGEVLEEGINFEVLRSGKQSRGKDARFLMEVNGKTASKDYEIGEGII